MRANIEAAPANPVAEQASPREREQAPPRPTLTAVARAISKDASQDTLKYLMRSDTSHDGE